MTTDNDFPERDPLLERAWRAHSRESPPPALDSAILAAAHRAVGSGPGATSVMTAEATRPQRWWMPLAAAATMGVVALGILQVAPPETVDIASPTATIPARQAPVVVDRAASTDVQRETLASGAAASAPKPEAAARDAGEPARGAAMARDRVPPASTPHPQRAAKNDAAPEGRVDAPVSAGSRSNIAPSAQDPVDALQKKRGVDQGSPAPERLAMSAPQPFPAAPAPASSAMGAAERRETKQQADPPADKAAAASEASSLPSPAPGPSGSMHARPPVPMAEGATDERVAAAKSLGMAAGAIHVRPSEGIAGAGAVPGAAAREEESTRAETRRDRAAAPAAPAMPARTSLAPNAASAKALQPDAWIARIRKLRAEGNDTDALRELREFRRLVADAEQRLPDDLRAWLDTSKP
jgi:hypothetical protein